MTHQLVTLFWIISNILTLHCYTFSVIYTFYFYIAFEELTFYQKCSIKCVLYSLFYSKKCFQKIWFSSQTKFWRSSQTHSRKCSKKALQKAFKVKSSQKSAKKKYSEKLLGSRIGSKKSRLTKKNAQQSFFCQKGPHKRQCSKKHSK